MSDFSLSCTNQRKQRARFFYHLAGDASSRFNVVSPYIYETSLQEKLVYSQEDLNMRRKAEVLKYSTNDHNKQKKQNYALLAKKVTKNKANSRPDNKIKLSDLHEGSVVQLVLNRYERDASARKICIDHFGIVCLVCGFDFQKTYGKLGKDFIHVHHIIPLAKIGKRYVVDPLADLRPVCPNCHAMLHRRDPPYEIDELRALIT